MKKKISIKNIIQLQLVVVIYSFSSVCAKAASDQELLSTKFLLLCALEVGILGIYAILWQQIIKKYDLSIAYANRAIALAWSMVWAFIIYNEKITLRNIIGAGIVLLGIMIINSDKEAQEDEPVIVSAEGENQHE